ncbi:MULTISPECIES: AMP-binding protein [Psychrobacter]|uniref:AMP-binding protein n=1 Tax=Psychrobacter TaxID=497 RepID=UPI000EDB8839|nr:MULTISPECIES: AMP-binding protein [Psychrobacter]HCH27809.1 hypothetical protein [Psychrobacter sp.]
MNNLYHYLKIHADISSDKPAIVFKDTSINYKQFNNFTQKVRNWVDEQGIQKGRIGFIFLPQTPQAIIWFFGLMSAGIIPSLMPLPSHKQDEKKYWDSHQQLIELTNPSLVITTAEWLSAFEDITENIECTVHNGGLLSSYTSNESVEDTKGKIAFLQHSSGTTGLKKGVALSHAAVIEQIESYSKSLSATSNDVIVSWLPIYHDMGLIACTIMPLVLGQTIVLLDPFEWVSKPISLLQTITDYKGTLVWLPNFGFEHLRRTIKPKKFDGLDLSSVKAFINCSEPCKAETFDRFINHFKGIGIAPEKLQVCYAMAETVYAVTQTEMDKVASKIWVDGQALLDNNVKLTTAKDGVQLLSCGKVIGGCQVAILDPDSNEPVDLDEVGEIVISGSFLFNGYYHRPEKTQEVFDGTSYRTRDLGFIHGDELYVLGRKDDLIISNGRNYFAHEIEQHVNALPNIKAGRNVAIGIYNDQIGSNEIYLVQERSQDQSVDDKLEKELIKIIRQTIQDNIGLLLRDVILVEASWLHKSSSGKISRELNKNKLLNFLNK